MSKIKKIIKRFKIYFNYVLDFARLNNYVLLSTKFINEVDSILYDDDFTDVEKIDYIKSVYSDFKVDYDKDDFKKGVDFKL